MYKPWTDRGGEGAEVLYALRNNGEFARLILEGIGNEGQKTRRYYQRRLPSNPNKDYNFLFRDTGVTEPVIVEYGFIDNRDDINRVANNYERYAEAVVKAVTDYKNLPYRPSGSMPNIPEVPNDNYYTVKAGDTLYAIANRYGMTVNELKTLNNLTGDILSIGQQLLLSNDMNGEDGNYEVYIVRPGDTLYGISNRYGTTVNDIKNLNRLTSDLLTVGMELLIPSGNQGSMTTYTVQSGDNLWQISRRFNTTINELRRLNNLTSDILSIGQTLLIP